MSSFEPVADDGSRTTRTFVSEPSFAISASRASVWSGGLDRSGIVLRGAPPTFLALGG